MVASQNGWRANDRSVIGSFPLPGGSVPLHVGSAGEVLAYVGRRYHAEVEPLQWPGCWGYAERDIRGSSEVSNHASGTALDLNAPRHPLGTNPAANYTAGQIAAIHRIVGDCGGLIRWGGDYVGRKDGMHFEVNDGVTPEQLDGLWTKLAGQPVPPTPAPTPAPAPASDQVRKDQFDLADTGFDPGAQDGVWGPASVAACKAFQSAAHIAVDGVCGPATRDMLHKVPSWHSHGNVADDAGGYPARQWQQQLAAHGWHIAVDNAWGAHSKSILAQFQADKGLTADGLRGPQSWTCLHCTVN